MLKRPPRQILAWFCIAASLWIGLGFQLHGLSHVLHDLEASSHRESLPDHKAVCDQCLQFASMDGALPSHAEAVASAPMAALADASIATPLRATAFTAYASRAPPPPC